MTLIDDFTREALAFEVDFSLPTMRVLRVFDAIAWQRGLPETVRFDNGPEFTSLAMLKWWPKTTFGCITSTLVNRRRSVTSNRSTAASETNFSIQTAIRISSPREPLRKTGSSTTTTFARTAPSDISRRRSSLSRGKKMLCSAHITRQGGIDYTTFSGSPNCHENRSLNHIDLVVKK
jgi:transposase InsO family protein